VAKVIADLVSKRLYELNSGAFFPKTKKDLFQKDFRNAKIFFSEISSSLTKVGKCREKLEVLYEGSRHLLRVCSVCAAEIK